MTSTLDTLLHGMASQRIRSQVILLLLLLLLLHNVFVRLQCFHQPANGLDCEVVYRTDGYILHICSGGSIPVLIRGPG